MNIVGLSGSLSSPSRTKGLVSAILNEVSSRSGHQTKLIDIADIAQDLGKTFSAENLSPALQKAYQQLETADVLVIGVPVYKASYPGLFKHFFDLIDHKVLEGKVAVIAATGGSDQHALVLEHQLRTLLNFLGVYTAPKTVFAKDADFTNYQVSSADITERIVLVAEQALWLARQHHATPVNTHEIVEPHLGLVASFA
ncbi:MAG: NAD(P)H-dependent oxidoreductase [Methylotenera sp.]|nr:NAD(P)H-dependent oxidoreductase [Methylotenera sp.]MDD4927254.1 NAD(P)H-dependent oxidoreductase [Methylotenera sp.]